MTKGAIIVLYWPKEIAMKMLDGKGKTRKGFKFKKTNHTHRDGAQTFAIDKKDYIVVQEENKLPKILNRTGTPRVKVKSEFTPSGSSTFILI